MKDLSGAEVAYADSGMAVDAHPLPPYEVRFSHTSQYCRYCVVVNARGDAVTKALPSGDAEYICEALNAYRNAGAIARLEVELASAKAVVSNVEEALKKIGLKPHAP